MQFFTEHNNVALQMTAFGGEQTRNPVVFLDVSVNAVVVGRLHAELFQAELGSAFTDVLSMFTGESRRAQPSGYKSAALRFDRKCCALVAEFGVRSPFKPLQPLYVAVPAPAWDVGGAEVLLALHVVNNVTSLELLFVDRHFQGNLRSYMFAGRLLGAKSVAQHKALVETLAGANAGRTCVQVHNCGLL